MGTSHATTAACSVRWSRTCCADSFLVLADYADVAACRERVSSAWRDPATLKDSRMSIFSTARAGKFLVRPRDRRRYCDQIVENPPCEDCP